MHAAQPFLDAREFLLARRARYDEAYRDFRWPALDRFNWALDWFDAYAAGNDRPALWLVSDVARRDAGGYIITSVGRADDVFTSSDCRISPFELRSAMVEHPDVAEAAVVPCPDPVRLSVAKAFLMLRADAEPSRETALALFVRERLAPYKRIRRIEFAELPKTISGKIRRVELRNLEVRRAADGGRSALEFREEDFPELRAERSRS